MTRDQFPPREKPVRARIRGMVFPAAWDEKGQILSVVIDTPDEQQYVVEPDEKGKDLIRLTRCEIDAEGNVWVNSSGTMVIRIQHYLILK
ncbi:MAG: hypothetical protein ACP5G0_05485 [Desulfomonilia bacterium]